MTSLISVPKARWIQSFWWDSFWMLSAIWLTLIVVVAGVGFKKAFVTATFLFSFQHALAVAHSWSTTYIVLFSKFFKEERKTRATRYVWWPLALAGVGLALGLAVAYGGLLWIYPYLLIYWAGHFWHFGRQDFGVLSVYRQRAGQTERAARDMDERYVQVMMYVIQPILFIKWLGDTPLRHLVTFGQPAVFDLIVGAGIWAYWSAIILTMAMLVYELRKPNSSWPRLLYILVIGSHAVFLYHKLLFYPLVYLWSHWLIATGLVSRINVRFMHEKDGRPFHHAVGIHFLIVAVTVAAVWGLTYPFTGMAVFNKDFAELATLIGQTVAEHRFLFGCVIGFFLGEQLVHYYCDRYLFRFKDANIRNLVGPLL